MELDGSGRIWTCLYCCGTKVGYAVRMVVHRPPASPSIEGAGLLRIHCVNAGGYVRAPPLIRSHAAHSERFAVTQGKAHQRRLPLRNGPRCLETVLAVWKRRPSSGNGVRRLETPCRCSIQGRASGNGTRRLETASAVWKCSGNAGWDRIPAQNFFLRTLHNALCLPTLGRGRG